MREKLVNSYQKARMKDLKIVGKEEKVIQRKSRMCYLVTKADDFPDITFHVAVANFKVKTAAPDGSRF